MAVTLGLAVTALRPPAADACSCDVNRIKLPADGAVDVPTNLGAVLVQDIGLGLEPEITLRGPGGMVPLGPPTLLIDWWQNSLRRIPILAPLAADATYTVVVVPESGSAHSWTFTTGATVDDEAPPPPGFEELRAARTFDPNGSDGICGDDASVLELSVQLPADAVAARVRVEGAGPSSPTDQTLPLAYMWLGDRFVLGSQTCFVKVELVRGAEVCVDLSVVDLAGNESAPARACTIVRDCANLDLLEASTDDILTCPLGGSSDPMDPPRFPWPMGGADTDAGGCAAGGGTDLAPLALVALLGVTRRRRRRPTRR
ncbi:MAG: MYXO-CTERM sorting domain-containing protein [Kofleriaceae bacterium]